MADFNDLLHIAGDFLDDADVDKMVQQGTKWLKALGLDTNMPPSGKMSQEEREAKKQEILEKVRVRQEKRVQKQQGGVQLPRPQGEPETSPESLSLAEERIREEQQAKAHDQSRLQPEPLIPERMVPERMVPEMLTPDSPVPEGFSEDLEKNFPLQPVFPTLSASLQVLTQIAGSGLGGAILVDEILEPPLAVRSGYLARCRRRTR